MSPSNVSIRIAEALAELHKLYPDWRFGQAVANVATWAKGPDSEAVWDVEDDEFLAALQAHISSRTVGAGGSRSVR